MRILVTGGAGYIGSVVTWQLVERGDHVVVYDSLIRGHRRAVHPGAVFVQGDLADRARRDSVLAEHQIEAIMHFAALMEAGESITTPAPSFRNITTGSLTLLE